MLLSAAEVKRMDRPDDKEHAMSPASCADGAATRFLRVSRTMVIVLVICLICLFVAGFLPVAWTTPEQAQASGPNWTVPTRTPPPILSHRTYLPIVARTR
jgi:hypothetical protein